MFERAKNPTVLTLGKGDVVVAHGFHEGYPCLWFAEAVNPGEVGESAEREKMEGSFCLRFANIKAVDAHIERVVKMVDGLEKALREQEEVK